MSLVLDLPSEIEAELATEAARLGLSLTEYAVRRIAAGRVETKVTFQLKDGTITYLLEYERPINLNDDNAVTSADIKSVKSETNTAHVTKAQAFTKLAG